MMVGGVAVEVICVFLSSNHLGTYPCLSASPFEVFDRSGSDPHREHFKDISTNAPPNAPLIVSSALKSSPFFFSSNIN